MVKVLNDVGYLNAVIGSDITVNDLGGLQGYGASIKGFLAHYSGAINQTYRTFDTRLEASESKAISSFLAKLNAIQVVLADEYPAALSTYATHVLTYESALRALGFESEAWTSRDGVSEVSEALRGRQLEAITAVADPLQKALNKATEALGSSDISLTAAVSTAQADLESSAARRQTLHDQFESAYQTFISGLESSLSTLSALETNMANAIAVSHIPVATVLGAIKSGTLTTDEMYYFDLVSSKEDAQALAAIIGDSPGDIVDIDPSKISDQVYIVVAEEITEWTQNQDIARFQQLITRLSDKTVEQNDIFTNNLLKAQDALAISLFRNMYAIHVQQSELPMDEEALAVSNLEMETYKRQLDALNRNNSLLVALQHLKIGQSVESATVPSAVGGRTLTGDSDTAQLYTYSKVAGKITFEIDDKERFVFVLNTETYYLTSADGNLPTVSYDETSPVIGSYDISATDGDFGASMGESSQRIQKLNKERQEAKDEMILNIIGDVTKTGISLLPYGPVALAAIELTNSLSEGQRQNLATTSKNLAKQGFEEIKATYKKRTGNDLIVNEKHKIYEKLGKSGLDVSANAFKYYKAYQQTLVRIDQEQNELKQKMYNKLVGQGATSLDGTELDKTVKQIHRQHHYDFRAFLISKELDEHGLKKAIKYMKVSEKDLKETIKDKIPNEGDREPLTSYLLGKDSNLTLADLSPYEFDRLDSIVSHLTGDGWTDLGNYLNEKYGVEP